MTEPSTPPTDAVRLNKRMAELKMCSRREADEWIANGWVKVNGKPAEMGVKVTPSDRIEVDNSDPAALAAWQGQWGEMPEPGIADAAIDGFTQWRLVERTRLNPGSAGGPVFHLGLVPQAGAMPNWASGDLAQVAVASDPARPRDYSIASVYADGEL